MDTNLPVFDISSDEEPALGESKVYPDDYDWLKELLETVEKKESQLGKVCCDDGDIDDGDDDEVVVVGVYNPTKPKSKSLKAAREGGGGGGDVAADDDCVVLDDDPDKLVAVADDPASDDEDDVQVVGQTGQIACRDYPHSRHLCVKFPFASSPHGDHCQLCHCYVCDSLAPCAYWGTGVNKVDHCHATDKEEMWKTQRELCRIGKDLVVPKISDSPLPVTDPHIHQAATCDHSQLGPSTLLQNQIPRQVAIRTCSSSTRLCVPNIIRRGRNHHSGFFPGRNRFQPQVVSQQPLGIRKYVIQRDRGPYFSNIGQHHAHPNSMFRRPGAVRNYMETNQSVYGSSNRSNVVHASGYRMGITPHATLAENSSHSSCLLSLLADNSLESYIYPSSHPNMGSVVPDATASALEVPTMTSGPEVPATESRPEVLTYMSRPEVSSQSIPRSNEGQSINQIKKRGQIPSEWRSVDLGTDLINNSIRSDGQGLADIQLQDTGANNDLSTVQQCSSQFCGSGSATLQHTDHDYLSWLSNQHAPVASEGCMSGDSNMFYTEPSAIDAGMMYFDFETSWNGLTRA